MQIKTYRFTGLTSLLMANIESVGRGLPLMKLGTKPNDGDIEKIAEGMTYKDEDGYYLPAGAFRSSLLVGTAGQKFPGSRQSPATIFKTLIFPAELKARLTLRDGSPIEKHEVQIDSAVNGQGKKKQRVIAVRARIPEWATTIPFEIDEEFAPANFQEFLAKVLDIWNRAGRVAGVGAWRPENSGRHGKYMVEAV